MAERSNGKKAASGTTLDLMGDDEAAKPRAARKPAAVSSPIETAGALFGGDEVDLDARHPADVPVGNFPAPSQIAQISDTADPFGEDDPFEDSVMARMLADEPVPLLSPLRAAREDFNAIAVEEVIGEEILAEEAPVMEVFAEPIVEAAVETITETIFEPKITQSIPSAAVLISFAEPIEESFMPVAAPEAPAAKTPSAPKTTKSVKTSSPGLAVPRRYTQPGQNVWSTVEWELRTASIVGSDGTIVFEQKGVEIPKAWSQLATNVVVSKYFRGQIGTLEREYSVKQLIGRVSDRILEWGKMGSYFASEADAEAFHDELRYILLHQYAAFNSPVWFNLGWAGRRQAVSACLPYDVRVNTDRGLLPIGEIVRLFRTLDNPQISTYAPDGTPSRVVAAVCNGRKRVINFHLADGSTLRCTSNHRVFVRASKGEIFEKQAGDLVIGVDRLVLNRSVILPETTFQSLNSITPDADVAWLTGLMVGDGYCGRSETLTSDTWDLKINTLPEKNRAESILTKYGIPFRTHIKPWGFCLRGHGAVSRAFWSALGLWGRVGDKQVPEWVYRTSAVNIGAFLGGLFDADGHVSENGNRRLPVFSNTSLPLMQATQTLLRSLGIYGTLTAYTDPRENYVRKTSYTLGIHDNLSVEQFEEVVGFTHAHKQAHMTERLIEAASSLRSADVLVVSKTLGGPEYVYDIQTESETFWAEGILLHNCYINEVDDTMESILDLYKTEGMLFKDGSGSGLNLSTLRSSKEPLEAGGRSSGPISFMKGLDASAGSIKSGGSTRRAACMRVLDIDHPDIKDFIDCKKDAEQKAHALIDAGYSGAFNVVNGAYDTVPFQNANHSVRVTDAFMQAVEDDGAWDTKFRTTGKTADTVRARDLMRGIAEGTWVCGDPGMQYDTIINDWHTCANTDRIYASNPCSEYMFLNSTACNLSSLNLMKFRQPGTMAFDTDSFEHAVRMMITAQEIVVGFAHYPTPKIEQRSHEYRTLGLGYANLGALLMAAGLPYDSDAGRSYAGAVTALMTGRAYHQSATIARDCGGPFSGFAENRDPMLRVMRKHRAHVDQINGALIPDTLLSAARTAWDETVELGEVYGYRNAQSTVLAPTGTIGFLMDCDTTGIEPDIAIVKYKSLVGGGMMKIVNQTVPEALQRLGYSEGEVEGIIKAIDANDTIEGAPGLKPEHLPIFDCAFRPMNGTRSIHYRGHIKMMAAAQPFISGAISKTVNVPNDATPEDIAETYLESWKLGIKAVAIYRDGSKRTQPLNTSKEAPAAEKAGASVSTAEETAVAALAPPKAVRRRLPDERAGVTHKFSIGGHEGYLTVGLYPDTNQPGEIFIRMSKEGSSISGLMDSFATAISLALQYGVPLQTLVDKFIHSRFEPSGFTGNKEIPMAKSVMDYIFRYLALRFLQKEDRHNVGLLADQDDAYTALPKLPSPPPAPNHDAKSGSLSNGKNGGNGHKSGNDLAHLAETNTASITDHEREIYRMQSDAPPCPECGAITIRSGACYKCLSCGTSLGCS